MPAPPRSIASGISRSRNNVLDLIDQVTRALQRIDEGTYGTCESCGRPIDAARIKAFPRVLLCLDCKRREERIR